MISECKALACILCVSGAPLSAETLSVHVTGLNSNSGTIRMALFSSKSGFPNEEFATAVRVINISAGGGSTMFQGLSAGSYAIAVYHDENGNERLDANLLGLPTEGYGFSNNARAALAPPRFSAAAFSVTGLNSTQSITIGY